MPPHGRSIVQEPSESFSDSPGERSQTVQMVRRFSRNVPGMMGLILVLIMALLSMGAPLLTNADPTSTDAMSILHAPEPEHPFGTDHLGRDVLSRFLYGSRVSILIGVSVAGVTAITGIVLGVLSGFYPRLDDPIMRAMDILMAFPVILLALGIVAILGPQLMNVFIALVVPYTPTAARVVRGMVLQVKEADFVEAARSIGASDWHIMRLHIVPNSLGPAVLHSCAGHPRRGHAVFSWGGSTPAGSNTGEYYRRGSFILAHRPVAIGAPGSGDFSAGVRLQPPGRRGAGRHGSSPEDESRLIMAGRFSGGDAGANKALPSARGEVDVPDLGSR